MRIVTYNIQWGKGRDRRIDLGRIARTVGDADVIALQEVERNWREQEHPDQALRLAELLPDFHWVYGPAVDLDGGRGVRRQIGNMILSRAAIASTRNLPLPAWPVMGHVNDQQAMLEAVIGDAFRVYNVHLNYLAQKQRLEQIERLMAFIDEAPQLGGPVTAPGKAELGPDDEWIVLPDGRFPQMPAPAILLGDFNSAPASRELAAVAAERKALHGRFADVLRLAGMGDDEGVTFPGDGSEPPQRLDHVFASTSLAASLKRAWIDTDAAGSDHQPVWAKFDIDLRR